MKLGIHDVIQGIEYTAIQKLTKELLKDGFSVKNGLILSQDNNKALRCDLYAEKENDKRIYEFKIGKNRIQKKQLGLLQDIAKQCSAKLYIVYLEIPKSKEVEFDGLELLIHQDLLNDFPNELDCLSTHTIIDSVDDIEIETMSISKNLVKITGSGTINVNLQFGSNSDCRNNNAVEDYASLDFFYKITVDINNNRIINHYYKIDTEK